MSSVREQNEALNKAVTGVAINLVKRVPIVGDLVSGIECYKNHIEKVQQERFIYSLADQLDKLQLEFRNKVVEFWEKEDNQVFVMKTVASAMNAEYTDKIEFLVNGLINGARQQTDEKERLKFVDLVKQVSVAAFDVLIIIEKSPKIQDNDGRVYDSIKDEQYLNFIAEKTKREKDFIRLCVSELDSLGFLSNQKIYGGERSGINSSARKFIKFVQSPAGTDN